MGLETEQSKPIIMSNYRICIVADDNQLSMR